VEWGISYGDGFENVKFNAETYFCADDFEYATTKDFFSLTFALTTTRNMILFCLSSVVMFFGLLFSFALKAIKNQENQA